VKIASGDARADSSTVRIVEMAVGRGYYLIYFIIYFIDPRLA
jgi:hypothetical protein